MTAADLARRLRAAVAAAEIDRELLDAILAFLDGAAAAAEGRAQALAENRAADLERMRAGTDRAIGALSAPEVSMRRRVRVIVQRISRRNPKAYGLPRMPGRRLIAERLLAADRATSEPIRRNSSATFRATMMTS